MVSKRRWRRISTMAACDGARLQQRERARERCGRSQGLGVHFIVQRGKGRGRQGGGVVELGG
jgi:hypothetical protein